MNLHFLNKLVFRAPLNSYDKRDVVNVDAMEEPLYLASPVLISEMKKGITDGKRLKKLQDSIYKYHSRSCTRCTPFGLFAGVGVGKWGDKSKIILRGNQRKTRLDMNYVCALGQYLVSLEEVKQRLLFYPNNSIYVIAGKARYAEYKFVQTQRLYSLSEVNYSLYLDKALRMSQEGAYAEDLALAITDAEINIEEAKEFISAVIESQLLKSELEPNVTGEFYFEKILQTLRRMQPDLNNPEIDMIIDTLAQIDAGIQQLDSNNCNSIDDYKNIISLIGQLPVPFEESQLFQADMYWNTSAASLDNKIQDELLNAIAFVNRLSPAPAETPLKKFAKELYDRYEHAEVPLLQALDTEAGVGYAHNKGKDNNPLIDGIITGERSVNASFDYSAVSIFLHKKLKEAFFNKQYSVNFSDEDIAQLPTAPAAALPATLAVGFSLPNDDEQIVMGYAAGPCAANILGRFCHGNDEIMSITQDIIQHENEFYKGKIVAEIVHLPEARTGNILLRPVLREYEIPYLSNAATSFDKTISLADLYVSVGAGDRIILRSKSLNKEIIPRLTNAHNFSFNSLPVYQFLCDLQGQGTKPAITFEWGSFEKEYQFTPRAVYGKVILKPATWKLNKDDVKELLWSFDKTKIAGFLSKWQMPSLVLLAEEDNALLVDWFNETSYHSFIDSIRQKEKFTLTEQLLKTSVIKDENANSYANEFLAVLLNNNLPQSEVQLPKLKEEKRSFPPGSEWLYYKIYTGKKNADAILSNSIKPIVEKLLYANQVDQWFFIRYLDPQHHLRVRLHLPSAGNAGSIINELSTFFDQLIQNGLAWKIQLDTYERELERYSLFGIQNCEAYFFHDSTFILSLINNIHGEIGERVRWVAGFKAIDELLNDFEFDISAKEKLVAALAQGFIKEFGDTKVLKLSLNHKYRQIRKDIETALSGEDPALQPITEMLYLKSLHTKSIIRNVHAFRDKHRFFTEYNNLISSLIHMMMNRLFRSQQRMHELVIYDLLAQFYRGQLSRLAVAEPLSVLSGVEGSKGPHSEGTERSRRAERRTSTPLSPCNLIVENDS